MEQQQQDYLGMDTIVAALSGLSDPEFEEILRLEKSARKGEEAEPLQIPCKSLAESFLVAQS